MITLSKRAAKIVQKKMEKNLTASRQSEKVTPHTENTIRTMRTKSLLFAAAVSLAGVASAVAQNNVYSVNAVGYVNLAVPSGFSLVANQLNSTNNTIQNLLATAPNFSQVFKWTGTGFDTATLIFGNWDKPTMTLNPGEGAFLNTSSAATITLVGEVPQGNLTNSFPVGYSIRSSQVPQQVDATAMGLTAAVANFDQVFKWNGNGYDTYTLIFGNWSPSLPTFKVGESFFINSVSGGKITRTFSVNQ